MTPSRFGDWFLNLIFPNRCPVCGKFIAWNEYVCEECIQEFTKGVFCSKCGMLECVCDACYFCYDGCAVLFQYSGKARDGILALKYHNGFNMAKFATPMLKDRLFEFGYLDDAAVITSVPMTKMRRRETGYNQAEYIAKQLSDITGIDCDFKLISKADSDLPQHALSAKERREAVKGLYFPAANHRDIDGKSVIICDDIITTGSTLSECASVLKREGAARVYAAVLGGSVYQQKEDNNVGP